jgi:hypothetical protein
MKTNTKRPKTTEPTPHQLILDELRQIKDLTFTLVYSIWFIAIVTFFVSLILSAQHR